MGGDTEGHYLRERIGNGHILCGVNTLRLYLTEIRVRGFLTPIPRATPAAVARFSRPSVSAGAGMKRWWCSSGAEWLAFSLGTWFAGGFR